jgi:hypothetical protein
MFVTIDRATRWVFLHIYHDMSDPSSIDFLRRLKVYNHHIPQRAIGSKTPIQALKGWQRQKPELFVKRVYEQTGLDTNHTAPSNRRLA